MQTLRVTYSDDLGEDDGERWLHRAVDDGTDGPHHNVRPLGEVETQHFQEGHRGHVFILQEVEERVESRFLFVCLSVLFLWEDIQKKKFDHR